MIGRHQVPAKVEQIMDSGMSTQKSLSRSTVSFGLQVHINNIDTGLTDTALSVQD